MQNFKEKSEIINTGIPGFFILRFIRVLFLGQYRIQRIRNEILRCEHKKEQESLQKDQHQEVKIKFMCLVSKTEVRKIHLDFQHNIFINCEQCQIGKKIGRKLLVPLVLSFGSLTPRKGLEVLE